MLFCINNQKCIYRVSDASILVWAPKLYAQTVEKLIQKTSYSDMFKNMEGLWTSKLLKRIDKKATLLLRYQSSGFIKDFSNSKVRILFFDNI